jgi:orotidine 5''-phosphate decarboxylase, subfamily 1
MKQSARDRIILALDVGDREKALALTQAVAPYVGTVKVGLQLFIAEGPDLIQELRDMGLEVFLDLKLHDIPNTVARAVEAAAKLDVQMLTVHLFGGREMVLAAVAAAPPNLLLLGVTVLTSASQDTLRGVGIEHGMAEQVMQLARLGIDCEIGGLITSAQEVSALRASVDPDRKLVVPGIRQHGTEKHDQLRTMTPSDALAAGADYLVIGRPITGQADPAAAAKKILEEIES